MGEKRGNWQTYFDFLIRRSLRSLLLGIPLTTAFFFLLSYLTASGDFDAQDALIVCLVYSVSIQFSMCMFFSLFWAGVTYLGNKAIAIAHKKISPHFALAFLGLGSGLAIARIVVSRISGAPPADFRVVMISFFWGALIAAVSGLFEVYRTNKAEIQQLSARTVESQLQALKNQMQPHFLFNSLNSLSELIEESPQQAAAMTEKLANLYRAILANSAEKTATVASEIQIVRDYLELESLRFGTRLHFHIHVEQGTEVLYLPSLVLQTLVENAVKHGIAPAIAGGEIWVQISKAEERQCRAEVKNSGQPLQQLNLQQPGNSGEGLLGASAKLSGFKIKGLGKGTTNTQKRLELLYGEVSQFRLHKDQDDCTVATFFFHGERFV